MVHNPHSCVNLSLDSNNQLRANRSATDNCEQHYAFHVQFDHEANKCAQFAHKYSDSVNQTTSYIKKRHSLSQQKMDNKSFIRRKVSVQTAPRRKASASLAAALKSPLTNFPTLQLHKQQHNSDKSTNENGLLYRTVISSIVKIMKL